MSLPPFKRGFRVSRFLPSGYAEYLGGLVGDATVEGGLFNTRPATLDHMTVQLPQPREHGMGNQVYEASWPTPATILPNPTDAIFYFWDIGRHDPTQFLANPIPGFPHPDTAVLQLRAYGNGVPGGGTGSVLPSNRTCSDGSYIVEVHKHFRIGMWGFWSNPWKLAAMVHQLQTANFLANETVTGSLTGATAVVKIADNTNDWLIFKRGTVVSTFNPHFSVGEIITGSVSGAQALVVTYEAEQDASIICQVNLGWIPYGRMTQKVPA